MLPSAGSPPGFPAPCLKLQDSVRAFGDCSLYIRKTEFTTGRPRVFQATCRDLKTTS